LKLSRGTAAFIAGIAVTGALASAALTVTPASASPATHSVQVPSWLHVQAAPRAVALESCGRWPQFGLGKGKRGQVVPGVEEWPVNSRGRQTSDGFVACQSGKVVTP